MANIDWGQVVTVEKKEEKELFDLRVLRKEEKQQKVNEIIVTVGGMAFQGDELSQSRMLKATECLQDDEEVNWILADNSVARVTKLQLRQALALSVSKMGEIWVS